MSDKVKYVLEVDDKGSPKLVKFGNTAEKSGKQASKAFSGAGQSVSSFAKELPGVGGAMSSLAAGPAATAGVAVGALAVGFGAMIKKSVDFADNMNDLSLRLGVSTERLSVLSLYAEQSGTDIETLASAMGKLGVKMSSGDKDLKSYGITAGTVDEALFQLADKVKNTEDPMLRLKIATDAFGKSGQTMLPLLAQGGDALKAMAQDAPIVSQEMANMADSFNDRMAAIKGRFAEVGLGIAENILPEMEKWAEVIERIMSAIGMVSDAQKRDAKITEGRNKIIATYGDVMQKDAADRKKYGLGERTSAVRISGMTLQEALAAFDRNNVRSSPGGAGTGPKGRFGAGAKTSGKSLANSVDYWDVNDLANAQYAYNRAMGGGETGYAQSVDFGGMSGMATDYYAGLPVSEKAKASMEAQYDKEREAESKKLEERRAEIASFYAGVTGGMKGAFSSAYSDIWKNGRDVASALYDAFSERFTDRLIDSLASISANGLMGLLTGGGSTAGQGVFSLLGFAGGGAPPVGSPSIVGERRAEMIIPRGPSRVEPTSGRGDTINITVSNPAEARSLVRSLKTDERRRNTGVR